MSTEKAPPAELVREIKELIIEALMLQDMRPEDIDEQAPLLSLIHISEPTRPY